MAEATLTTQLPRKMVIVSRILLALAVVIGTVTLAHWGWAAFKSNYIAGSTLAWLCMLACVGQLAWYSVAAKAELNNQVVWRNRDAAFTALIMCGASILLLITACATGGPQITTSEISWRSGFWIPLLVTGVLNIFIQFAGVRAKALEDVSLVGPIYSTTPAVVIVIGMFVLGEYPGLYGWIGIWLLAIGTYSLQINDLVEKIANKPAGEVSATLDKVVSDRRGWRYWISVWLAPLIALKSSRGVRWAFLGVILACVTLNYDALVARNANVAFASGCVFGIAGLGNLAWAMSKRQFSGLNVLYVIHATVLLIVLFAMLHVVLNIAFRATLMSHIGALKRLSIPLTIIGAYFFLGERKKFAGRFVGGTIMAIGAILIALDM